MLLAKKINMTQVYDESKNVVPVTILDYSECYKVEGQKKSGQFVCIGKAKKPGKQQLGVFGEGNVPAYSKRVNEESSELDEITEGDIITIVGQSKGKGYAGVVKMWSFAGGPRTHGQSDRERHGGSIGNRTIPGRVYKGKKMGRRKGSESETIRGVKVISVDTENKLICVKGSVPGSYNSIVEIVKK